MQWMIYQLPKKVLAELDLQLRCLQDCVRSNPVYREDLKQYPQNGWSLFGLMKSLEAQGKNSEVVEAKAQFEKAWAHADVALAASQF